MAVAPESTSAGAADRKALPVSVIIPTWNRAARVVEAVRSVLEQSFRDLEVLVIDDGSADATSAALASIRDPRLRHVSGPRRGVSAARNEGIRRSAGEWIALLDSDDRWLPDKLEVQRQDLDANPWALICHCDEIWIRNGRRVNPRRIHEKRGGEIFEHCLPRCAISPSSALLRRSLFEEVGLFDETMPACEDYDLWLRISARHPVLYLDRQLVIKTGGHADQLSATVPAQDRYRIQALAKILDGGQLDAGRAGGDQRRAALAMLRRKIDVYRAGALKRGRMEEVAELDALADRLGA